MGEEVIRLIEFDVDVHGLDMLIATERPGHAAETWTKQEAGETVLLIAFAIIVTLQLIDRGEKPLVLQKGPEPSSTHLAGDICDHSAPRHGARALASRPSAS